MDNDSFTKGRELSIRDILADILLQWKILLCGAVIGMLLLGVAGVKKIYNEEKQSVRPEINQSVDARSALSDNDAKTVEEVYQQYKILHDYLLELEKYSTNLVSSRDSKNKLKIVKYEIISNMKNVNTYFTDMALSSEDFSRIRKIYRVDDTGDNKDDSEEQIPVQMSSTVSSISVSNATGNTQIITSRDSTLVTVFICASSEDQCDQIQKIVDDAFQKEKKALEELDTNFSMRKVDDKYSPDIRPYLDGPYRGYVERYNSIKDSLISIKNNYVDRFSESQKNYFESLKAGKIEAGQKNDQEMSQEQENMATETRQDVSIRFILLSSKFLKYLIVGAVAGIALASFYIMFKYLTDECIQTRKDVEKIYIPILETLYYKDGSNIILPIVRKLRHVSPSSIEVQEHMLAKDILLFLQSEHGRSLYFLQTSEDPRDQEVVSHIQDILKSENISINNGNPTTSPEELEKLSEADQIILMMHLKMSRREDVRRSLELCDRYHKKLSGIIVIGLC